MSPAPLETSNFLDGSNPCSLLPEIHTSNDFDRPKIKAFVIAAFDNAVISTDWIECQFAHVKQWLSHSFRPLTIAQLAARYVNHHWTVLHEVEGQQELPQRRRRKIAKTDGKGTPAWARREQKLNGEHIFLSEHLHVTNVEGVGRNRKDAFKESVPEPTLNSVE